MESIILPENFKITKHAAERFLERIMEVDQFTSNTRKVAETILRNALSRRVLRVVDKDDDILKFVLKDALFVYNQSLKLIITIGNNREKPKEFFEWTYRLPSGISFSKDISQKSKKGLLLKGMMPVRKKGNSLIGRHGDTLYSLDLQSNTLSRFEWVPSKSKEIVVELEKENINSELHHANIDDNLTVHSLSTAVRIRFARIQAYQTQLQLAILIGVSQSTISRFESGRAVPKQQVLIKISQATNVPVDYLTNS